MFFLKLAATACILIHSLVTLRLCVAPVKGFGQLIVTLRIVADVLLVWWAYTWWF